MRPSSRRLRRRSPLALWHLLSLDAPSIAALWTWFVAASCAVHISRATIVAMFLAVWLLYIGDRLLDARRLSAQFARAASASLAGCSELHCFHARNRGRFLWTAAAVAFVLAGTLARFPVAALRLYAVLGVLLAVYFFLVHALDEEPRLPKELAVGAFFSAAVFVPTVAQKPQLRLHLLPLALLFAALCSINCLRIFAWEHPEAASPRRKGHGSPPLRAERPHVHGLTRAALRHVAALHGGLTTIALIVALWSHSEIALAIACSAFALALLHLGRDRASRLHLRAAADLVLAMPLPVSLLARFWH